MSVSRGFAWIRYRGRIVGWQTGSGRKFLIDALTARAIRKSKNPQPPARRPVRTS